MNTTKFQQIENIQLMLESLENALKDFRNVISLEGQQHINNALPGVDYIRAEIWKLDKLFEQTKEGKDLL